MQSWQGEKRLEVHPSGMARSFLLSKTKVPNFVRMLQVDGCGSDPGVARECIAVLEEARHVVGVVGLVDGQGDRGRHGQVNPSAEATLLRDADDVLPAVRGQGER